MHYGVGFHLVKELLLGPVFTLLRRYFAYVFPQLAFQYDGYEHDEYFPRYSPVVVVSEPVEVGGVLHVVKVQLDIVPAPVRGKCLLGVPSVCTYFCRLDGALLWFEVTIL